MSIRKLFQCVMLAFGCTCFSSNGETASERTLPSPLAIHEACDSLWSQGKYNELYDYISNLSASNSDYLPICLAMIRRDEKYGGCYETALDKMKQLRKELECCYPLPSPIFLEELAAWEKRIADLASFYQSRGISQEKRRQLMDPREKTTFKFAKKWGCDEVFYTSPPLLFAERCLADVSIDPPPPSKRLLELNITNFYRLAESDLSLIERKAVAEHLVAHQLQLGNIPSILANLHESLALYTFDASAAALVKIGDDAIPVVLRDIEEQRSFTNKKMDIWIIARIGLISPEIRNALNKIIVDGDAESASMHHGKRQLAIIAKKTIAYLENRNAQRGK